MAESERGRTFNNLVSGIAAIAGTIGLIVATIISSEVNKLSQQSRTAGLVGNLTGKLTAKQLDRDISLLAIEHMLNTEPGKEQAPGDKLLPARISVLLIEGSSGEESIQAARVLHRLVQSSGEACHVNDQEQFSSLKLKLGGKDQTPAADMEADGGLTGPGQGGQSAQCTPARSGPCQESTQRTKPGRRHHSSGRSVHGGTAETPPEGAAVHTVPFVSSTRPTTTWPGS
ncbi:hypothetical protein VB738_12920 [Cyanobium gracile UHCC 0139]|uniref:Uncharacterized protein n=1 Tax=Cyanobium gracile UHCC 0139 TaxID=3110308 RepID=A0ABU5RWJ2_9CYAN|nr:hypothetical protein [Cyanobium gracile]MEA5392160.1 hypothetical protein [Cyanobium gracile UHCC 0139]